MQAENPFPAVLSIAGLDPSGGAGIAADLLTFASMGVHGCAALSALTVQDTQDVKGFVSMDPTDVAAQARAVLEDIPIRAIKLGMLPSIGIMEAVAAILMDYPDIPLVLDPVLQAGGGGALVEEDLRDAMKTLLLPRCALVTPNSLEARQLAPEADNLEAAGQALLALGADHVLITGGHEPTPELESLLFHDSRLLERYAQPRLPGQYHGTGCTLSAAVAAALAHGLDMRNAVEEALAFTHSAVQFAYRAGLGQLIPDRLFWARNDYDIDPQSGPGVH